MSVGNRLLKRQLRLAQSLVPSPCTESLYWCCFSQSLAVFISLANITEVSSLTINHEVHLYNLEAVLRKRVCIVG